MECFAATDLCALVFRWPLVIPSASGGTFPVDAGRVLWLPVSSDRGSNENHSGLGGCLNLIRSMQLTAKTAWIPQVCKAGAKLSADQAALLRHFDIKMAKFKMYLVCKWTKEGEGAVPDCHRPRPCLVFCLFPDLSARVSLKGAEFEEIRSEEDLELELGSDAEEETIEEFP